jgi:hypothetical protein
VDADLDTLRPHCPSRSTSCWSRDRSWRPGGQLWASSPSSATPSWSPWRPCRPCSGSPLRPLAPPRRPPSAAPVPPPALPVRLQQAPPRGGRAAGSCHLGGRHRHQPVKRRRLDRGLDPAGVRPLPGDHQALRVGRVGPIWLLRQPFALVLGAAAAPGLYPARPPDPVRVDRGQGRRAPGPAGPAGRGAEKLVSAGPGQRLLADKHDYGREFEAILVELGVWLLRPTRKGEAPRSGGGLFKSESCRASSPWPPRSGTTTRPDSRPYGPCSPTTTDPLESIV